VHQRSRGSRVLWAQVLKTKEKNSSKERAKRKEHVTFFAEREICEEERERASREIRVVVFFANGIEICRFKGG